MKRASLVRSTGIVAFSTLLSRILGFVRDMLTAKYFGASGSLDAFFVAFRIPNLFRRLVAEGALTVSFIPVYSDYLVNRGESEALALAQKTLTLLLVILTFMVSLGILFSPELVNVIAYGFAHPSKIEMTVALNRIMFPYLFFVSIVAFAMGVLNSHDYFFAPAFSPVLLNVGIILGIYVLSPLFAEPLYGMALGVILGGILQLLMQIPYMVKSGFKMKLSLDFRHPGIRKIFSLVVPTLFGFAIYQINVLMSTLLASFLPEGSISYLYYSDRLTEMVLGIFIVSIGNVILPAMSRISATNNMENLKTLYGTSMSAALFLAIPASAALMTAGLPIVSVLFMRDQFTQIHAVLTERALFFASMGIVSIALLRITTPTFYSLKDTRIPVLSSLISFMLNITLGYFLMKTSLMHAGLSLANSISSSVQVIILLVLLKRKIGRLGGVAIWKSTMKFIAAAAIMSIVILSLSTRADWMRDGLLKRLSVLVLMVTAGGVAYFAACAALGVPELAYLGRKLRELRK